MHLEAFAFVKRALDGHRWTGREQIVEIGARNINGSIRPLFVHGGPYTAIDAEPGVGVDVVIAGERYQHAEPIDLAVCCEVLEHAAGWRDLIANIAAQLRLSGKLIITTAGPERVQHSGIDGGLVRDGEHYQNLTADDIADAVGPHFDLLVEYGREKQDVYAVVTNRGIS